MELVLYMECNSRQRARNYEVCYKETLSRTGNTNNSEHERTDDLMCCRVTNTGLMNFKYECLEKDSFLQKRPFLFILAILAIATLSFYFVGFLYMLLSHSFFKEEHPNYYKLQESMISLTSIFIKMFWEKNGSIGVIICRKFLILLASCCNMYLSITLITSSDRRFHVAVILFYFLMSLFVSWLTNHFFSSMVGCEVSEMRNFRMPLLCVKKESPAFFYCTLPLIPFTFYFFPQRWLSL